MRGELSGAWSLLTPVAPSSVAGTEPSLKSSIADLGGMPTG